MSWPSRDITRRPLRPHRIARNRFVALLIGVPTAFAIARHKMPDRPQ